MSVVDTETMGKRVCDALGLDASKTASVSICFEPNNVVTAEIRQFVHDGSMTMIEDIFATLEVRRVVGPDAFELPIEPRW